MEQEKQGERHQQPYLKITSRFIIQTVKISVFKPKNVKILEHWKFERTKYLSRWTRSIFIVIFLVIL